MRIAITTALYNEEANIARLLDALLRQSRLADEIIVSDDGSSDTTGAVVKQYATRHPLIRYLHQENRGPAAARNLAWRSTEADVCLFTDGDCVPEPDWIEKLIAPFDREEIGAAAGGYRTLNPESLLARFIGLEIDWRYRHVHGEIDCHGSYNLAVRRALLEEIGGFREDYPHPSGEDWDLTYKISRRAKIVFVPEARVGHYHPEDFGWYMRNQERRAFDRIKVYRDHPAKSTQDTYTGPLTKYQIIAAAAVVPALIGGLLFPTLLPFVPALLLFLVLTSFIPFGFYWARDPAVAFASLCFQMPRYFGWAWGSLWGAWVFWIRRDPS